jgi:hypothetical protein
VGGKFEKTQGFYIIVHKDALNKPRYLGRAAGTAEGIYNRMRQYTTRGPKSKGPGLLAKINKNRRKKVALGDLYVWQGIPTPTPYSTWDSIEHALIRSVKTRTGNKQLADQPLRASGSMKIKNVFEGAKKNVVADVDLKDQDILELWVQQALR